MYNKLIQHVVGMNRDYNRRANSYSHLIITGCSLLYLSKPNDTLAFLPYLFLLQFLFSTQCHRTHKLRLYLKFPSAVISKPRF